MNSKILAIQIRTDLDELEKDVEAGMFLKPGSLKYFLEAKGKILKKVDKFWELAGEEIESFKREKIV